MKIICNLTAYVAHVKIAYIVKYYIVYYVFSILVIKIVKLQLEISVLLCTYISQSTNIPE